MFSPLAVNNRGHDMDHSGAPENASQIFTEAEEAMEGRWSQDQAPVNRQETNS
jgi:hypothetical protein